MASTLLGMDSVLQELHQFCLRNMQINPVFAHKRVETSGTIRWLLAVIVCQLLMPLWTC